MVSMHQPRPIPRTGAGATPGDQPRLTSQVAAESDRPEFGAHWARSWSTGSTAVNELIIPQMFTTLLLSTVIRSRGRRR